MNENISSFLKEYVDNPDPQYAIFLKGKWGCGKSFFIEKWIDEYKFPQGADGEIVLEPIKVSLYGKKTIIQISEDINRALHPILYSKGVNTLKKVIDIAGRVVFRTGFDWNKDGDPDLTFSSSIDSLSLFASDNKEIKGIRFLIFDDLERCQVDMKELLGYINYFVEHCSCHVVLLGDETHMPEGCERILAEFKEKTIGREFEILPDIDEAVSCFLRNNLPVIERLIELKDFITYIFKISEYNNLRVLRQCLYDFKIQIQGNEILTPDNSALLKKVLGCFIMTYCEYKGGKQEALKNWDGSLLFPLLEPEDSGKSDIVSILHKYDSERVFGIDILDKECVDVVIKQIEKGSPILDYLNGCILKSKEIEDSPINILSNYFDLTNDVFILNCNKLIQSIENKQIGNASLLGRGIGLLLLFDYYEMFLITDEIYSDFKSIIRWFYNNFKSQEEVHKSHYLFINEFRSYNGSSIEKIREIREFAKMEYQRLMNAIPNKLQEMLYSLNDTNVRQLVTIDNQPTPDNGTLFESLPLFSRINKEEMFDKVVNLSNTGKHCFCEFLYHHYKPERRDSGKRYASDIGVLQYISEQLANSIANSEAVDLFANKVLKKHIDKCIEKCNTI